VRRSLAAQLSRTPRLVSRTLATQAPFPPASTSTSGIASSTPEGSTINGTQSVFPGGDVDVTDSVLKMLESEDGKRDLHPSGRSRSISSRQEVESSSFPNRRIDISAGLSGEAESMSQPISYLPISSLASPNPTLPSPQVSRPVQSLYLIRHYPTEPRLTGPSQPLLQLPGTRCTPSSYRVRSTVEARYPAQMFRLLPGQHATSTSCSEIDSGRVH